MKKWLKRILIGLLGLFLLFSILPYLFSLEEQKTFPPDDPFLESEFQEIDGLTLHYRQFFPEINPPKGKILFIHGLGGSTFSWRENMTFFKEAGYLVLAVDLPGFGYSTKASGVDHSQKNRSNLLWTLLDGIDDGLDEVSASMSWTLAGHSMGGGAATAMTIDRPEKTEHLILVDGAVFENQPGFVSSLLTYPPLGRGIKVIFDRILLSERRIENFLTSAYGRQANPVEIKGYLDPLLLPGTPNVALDLVSTAKNVPVEGLQNNQVPILALWGEEDTWVPLAEAKEIQTLMPRTTVKSLPGAYHCPMETHAKLFNEALLDFLEEPLQ